MITLQVFLRLTCDDNRAHRLPHWAQYMGPNEEHIVEQAKNDGWRIEKDGKTVCANCVKQQETK